MLRRVAKTFIGKETKVIVQGITGKQGTYHAQVSQNYGTQIVGGVNPKNFNVKHLGVPVFKSCFDAKKQTNCDASIIFVPAPTCKQAIMEAIEAEIPLIVAITEGIPLHDMMYIKNALKTQNKSRLIGPNCPGIIKPDECRIGIMPPEIHKRGKVGIIS